MRSVSRCRWCAATATFLLAVHVCSVCKGEAGEIEGLVPIILRARLIVPEPALSVVIPVHNCVARVITSTEVEGMPPGGFVRYSRSVYL